MNIHQSKTQIVIFCVAGFFGGILYANFISNQIFNTSGIFSEYFLSQYPSIEIISKEYICYVLRIRLTPLIFLFLLGQTKIRKTMISLFLFWIGFSGGILIVTSIFRLGMKGIMLFVIGTMPQFLFYVLGYALVIWYLYIYPMSKWNYSKTVFLFSMIVLGVIMEVYVNPILMKMFVRTI
ncbi:stage II sporulation protein M [Faecalimonas sp.]